VIRFGSAAVPYGVPDAYVIVGRGTNDEGESVMSSTQITVLNLREIQRPWLILAWVFIRLTAQLRELGAEPRDWECGGYWYESEPFELMRGM
jgi:hypothetical protein